MSDHLRPPHPGCTTCRNRALELTNLDGDLGHAKRNLIRAQEGRPEDVPQYVAELEDFKARRTQSIEIYKQHYVSTHPSFSDADAPFAKSPSRRLDDDQVAELRDLLRDGDHTYAEIADVFDISTSTVQYHAARAGLSTADRKAAVLASTPSTVTDAEGGPTPDPSSASPLPLLGRGQAPEWMDRGICHQTDPEAFFPEKGGSTREAKSVCATCPVAAECLDYALDNDERFGIWGGLSERDRRKIKRALQDDAGVARIPCPRCDATFDTDTALASHARHHDRPPAEDLPCPHCNHVGKGHQGLAVHITRTHPEHRTAS
jgi:WhiB family redox-sensing transcriptional regulator